MSAASRVKRSSAYVRPGPLVPARAAPVEASRRVERIARPLVGATLLALFALYAANVDAARLARYGPALLEGLGRTAILVGVATLLGAIIGGLLTAARLGPSRALRGLAFGYSYLFRGTPLLVQVFFLYYGAGEFREALETVGLWWVVRDPFTCAILAFSLNTAAYQSEIVHGAVRSVPRGQWEGAASLGLPRWLVWVRIVLPQALITSVRPLGNELIFLIKGSAIASIITVYDLMGETRLAYSRTYDFDIYLWAAVLYLGLVEAVRRAVAMAETRLTRHLIR